MKKYVFSVHLWFWILLISFFTLGIMFFSSFFVPQQEIQKPIDILSCETDNDCTTTMIPEEGCSSTCPRVINQKGKVYLNFLQEANCKVKNDTLPINCPPTPTVFCEDNQCTTLTFEGRRLIFLNADPDKSMNLGSQGMVELGIKNYKDTPLRFKIDIEVVGEPDAAKGELNYNDWFPNMEEAVHSLQPLEWTRIPIQLLPPTGIFQGKYEFHIKILDQDAEEPFYTQGTLTITVGR